MANVPVEAVNYVAKAREAVLAAGYKLCDDPDVINDNEPIFYIALGLVDDVYRGVYVTWAGNGPVPSLENMGITLDVSLWPVNENNRLLIDYPEAGDSNMTIEEMLAFLKSEKENPTDLSDYIGAKPI